VPSPLERFIGRRVRFQQLGLSIRAHLRERRLSDEAQRLVLRAIGAGLSPPADPAQPSTDWQERFARALARRSPMRLVVVSQKVSSEEAAVSALRSHPVLWDGQKAIRGWLDAVDGATRVRLAEGQPPLAPADFKMVEQAIAEAESLLAWLEHGPAPDDPSASPAIALARRRR
jgi:hypothetical protein